MLRVKTQDGVLPRVLLVLVLKPVLVPLGMCDGRGLSGTLRSSAPRPQVSDTFDCHKPGGCRVLVYSEGSTASKREEKEVSVSVGSGCLHEPEKCGDSTLHATARGAERQLS